MNPVIFTGDRAASRYLADAPYPVVADANPDARSAIRHLQWAKGGECISVEAGTSTTRPLFERPVAIDELLLSVYRETELDERAMGPDFLSQSQLNAAFAESSAATHRDESGSWSFQRWQRTR